MARVLRPGGRLVLTDADEHDQVWMREAMAYGWLRFKREEVRARFEADGLTDVYVDCARGNRGMKAPVGLPLSIGKFLAMRTKRISRRTASA